MDTYKCLVCGAEFSSLFCPDCGAPRNQAPKAAAPSAPERLSFEDLAGSVWEFTGRAREKQQLNKHGEVQLAFSEDGGIRLVIVNDPYAEIYVGNIRPEKPRDFGLRREDGGFVGSGHASQPGFSAHVYYAGNGLLRLYADPMPAPISFAGFDYYLEKIGKASEIKLPEGMKSAPAGILTPQLNASGALPKKTKRCAFCYFDAPAEASFCPMCGGKFEE